MNVTFQPAIGSPSCFVTSSTMALASAAVAGLQLSGNSRSGVPVRRASSRRRAASDIRRDSIHPLLTYARLTVATDRIFRDDYDGSWRRYMGKVNSQSRSAPAL